MELARKLTDRWTAHGISCPPGASASDLAQFESHYSVQLPSDLRRYFITVNGMGERGTCDNDFYSFWQLSDVSTITEDLPDRADRFPDSPHYFLIADHSIFLPAFAIRLSVDGSAPNPIVRVIADAGVLDVETAFPSFTDFVEHYLRDPLDATVSSITDT